MVTTDTTSELRRFHERKLADAKHALRAFDDGWQSYRHASESFQKELEEHAEKTAVYQRDHERYEAFLRLTEERKALASDLARQHLRASTAWEDDLRELLVQHVEVSVEITSVLRQTVVLPRKRGTAIAFRARQVPEEGLHAGLAHKLLQVFPRANRHLYTYQVQYARRYHARALAALAADLAYFLAEHLGAAVARATPKEKAPLFQPGWIPLPALVLERVLPALLDHARLEDGTLQSNNPAESNRTLRQNPQLRAYSESSLARELIAMLNGTLLPRLVERIPVYSTSPPPAPIDPGLPPEPPEPPRLVPDSTRLWEDLPWEAHCLRLKMEEERAPEQHLLLGYDPGDLEPIFLRRSLLHSHAHVVGATQSGKTSAALIPILTQLVRGSDEPPLAGESQGSPAPILIIDLKGDFALFRTAQLEAAKRGQAFRFFTTHPEKDSHTFDLFGSLTSLVPTAADLGGFIAQALDLFHGPGYGHGYYSKENREAIVSALDFDREQTGGALPSLASIGEALKATGSKKTGHDAREAQATIAPLVRPEMASRLERGPECDPSRVIHMPTAIENREVLYFWIPVLRSTSGLDIARLALYSFMHAVAERHYSKGDRRAYAIIDEFQEVASFNIGRLLTFSAGVGLSLIMANQSVRNLKVGNTDIRDHVTTNANVRLFFSVATADDIEELQRLSGEKEVWLRSRQRSRGGSMGMSSTFSESTSFSDAKAKNWSTAWGEMWGEFSSGSTGPHGSTVGSGTSHGSNKQETEGRGDVHTDGGGESTAKGEAEGRNWSSTVGRTQTIRPRLDADEILDASLVDRACVVISKRDAGRTSLDGRPRGIRSLYSMDQDEYEVRRGALWPAAKRDSPESGAAVPAPSPSPPPKQPTKRRDHPKRSERGLTLQRFFDEHAPTHSKENPHGREQPD